MTHESPVPQEGAAPQEDVRVDAATDFPPAEDAVQRLWTPHRMVYIGGQDKPADATAGECPFCRIPARDDEDGLVVARGTTCFVVLNLYPYNPGHLLVCPYRHVADYTDLTAAETHELARLTQTAMRVVREVSGPAGFNLGMNQGEVAGAGIAAHLHQHVVPRWLGDANFLPVVGQTKAVPQLLADTRARLAAAWPAEPAEPAGPAERGDA
ncbi:HIT domain-containing protein [Cellulomonas sp. PhB143]|uniref:HIT family protein n=1 Tax=Cellulomonas sp. PhB143 TaxID=2485186 RepID=UPI000F47A61B|nr:HIT domain-containing protein [Cellulomonas sp. PhB143]ROS74592.1 ATP adenylyltransferase [Cellulomonas sp. PhB143]